MIGNLKTLFGIGPKVNYAELIKQGAQVVDVRTEGEFSTGHIKGSVNIPLQQLQHKLKKLDTKKPVITCCASGMRSASAKSLLISNGFKEVHNGGGWSKLESKLQ